MNESLAFGNDWAQAKGIQEKEKSRQSCSIKKRANSPKFRCNQFF